MKLPNRAALAAGFRDLGPLRPVAVYTAVVPTIGAIVALALLSSSTQFAAPTALHLALATALTAVATALVLLPPMACVLVCSYGFGWLGGGLAAWGGIAVGAAMARAWVWPRLGPELFAWMRDRPRAQAVRRLGGERPWWGVVQLRAAAPFPFAVQNLLFTAAAVPVRSVFAGTLLGLLVPATGVAVGAALLRAWREHALLPTGPQWAALAGMLLLTVRLMVAGRRGWRRAGAAG